MASEVSARRPAHLETPSKPQSTHPTQMASVLTPLLSCRGQLPDRHTGVSPPKRADARYGFVDFFLSAIRLGDDPGDGAAMAGDDQRFAPCHLIEQLRQVGFGFGSLDLVEDRSAAKRPVF
jgi:hypothetical protein